jgi:hypothetical protein
MARRFYLPIGDVPVVSPAFDTAWQATGSALRRRMNTIVKTANDSVAAQSAVASTAGQATCHRQFVSDPMNSGLVFDTSTTYKCQIQMFESAINDNAYPVCSLRIVSYDGSTVRATLLALAANGTGTGPGFTEFNTTIRNISYINGDVGQNASYTTQAGDRLVLETGHNDNGGATISVTPRFGEVAAGGDLAEDETATGTTLRPWFETSVTVTFLELAWDYDTSPDNTAMGASNSPMTATAGSTVSDNGRAAAVGSFSGMMAAVAGSITNRYDFIAANEAWFRFYFQMDTLPSASAQILLVRAAGSANADCQIGTSGEVRLRNQASTLIDTSAGNLSVDVWHRLEFHLTTTRWEARIFSSPTEHGSGAAAVETETTFGGATTAANFDNISIGIGLSTTWTIWLDALKIRFDGWVGSAAPYSLSPRARHPMQAQLVR